MCKYKREKMYRSVSGLLQNIITVVPVQRHRQIWKSALFVPGEKAMDVYSAVIPYLDFDEQLKDVTKLEENLKRRQLTHDIHDLKSVWEFYKAWKDAKCRVEDNRVEVAARLKEVSKWEDGDKKDREIKRLALLGKLLREDLKNISESVSGIEENVILRLLSLPNSLHEETPLKTKVIKEYKKVNCCSGKNHLNIGADLGYLQYTDEKNYYLKSKATLFELAAIFYFTEQFITKSFIHFSNSDFARSVLVEGVGLNPDDAANVFLLNETEGNKDKLHLTGSGSLFPFCGFHAKQVTNCEQLPVRYIAAGQSYSPMSSTCLKGLYSVWQSPSVHMFIGAQNKSTMYSEYKNSLNFLVELYENLNLSFRVVSQPAECLKPWESLKTSIQIFSIYNNDYVEVASMSIIDDYISKRLRMSYEESKQERFLKVVSGNVVNVARLLAVCLEHSKSDLYIPQAIQKHILM